MKAFSKFDNTAEALAAAASMVDSKIGKDLKKFLKKHAEGETVALADAKLGGLIKDKLGIACVYSSGVMELMRGVRLQLNELIGGLTDAERVGVLERQLSSLQSLLELSDKKLP